MSNAIRFSKRQAVSYSIMILIAIAHLVGIRNYLRGANFNLYISYFSDIVMPFGFYLLLCGAEPQTPFLKGWGVKLATAFLVPSIAETFQYFGIPVLGSTFDPLDYLMYAIGAMSAAIIDTQVFSRIFDFWPIERAET
jgi:hypothetical protein